VMLMMPNKEVWTFNAHQDRVDVDDSVYLAGSEGPRRTFQLIIRGHARTAARVQWLLQTYPVAGVHAAATPQTQDEEPRLPL
ncbi:MAG TPA: heparinase II/III family protein, partial [Xanthobacteraceae bacterium]|nr:heparinase II/III family protein [Xanthobacteraceae bacterium]